MNRKHDFTTLLAICAFSVSGAPMSAARAADVVSTRFHLTSRPWTGSPVAKSTILASIKTLVGYFVRIQNSDGSIDVNGSPGNQASAILAYGGATLVAAGDLTYLAQTEKAMNWTATSYRTIASSATSGPDFVMGPMAKAYSLLAASGQVGAAQLSTWASTMTAIKATASNDRENWGGYAIDGAYQMAKAGLVSASSAESFIESLASIQEGQYYSPNGLYQDHSTSPDSMSAEAAGRGRLLDMVVSGYDGPSAARHTALAAMGSATSLTLESPSGDAPTGGRTSDHVWVDAGYQSILETVAQNTSDPTLAGQYQRASDLAFDSVRRFAHSDGSYSVTKNFYPDSQRVGYQTASYYNSYNANVLLGMGESYNAIARTITPVAAPVEIGGYSFNTGPDWGTAFAGAGGTSVEIELTSTGTYSFSNYWSSLGIVRIGATGLDSRIGPADGRYTGTDGVSFAPEWQTASGGWQHLAGKGGQYSGSLTTMVATPVLTIDQIRWAPNSGTSGPSFSQTLIITPDGIMSKTTQTGASSGWGMTLPLFTTDNQTSAVLSTGGGIASTSAFGGTESFIALDPTVGLTSESRIVSSYGAITPIRAVGTASEQDVFVYQGHSGISASALKSGMAATATGYTSSVGSVAGTLYSGLTSAGGYGASITLGSGEVASFGSACNFILQVSKGVVTNAETDRAVTATIGGNSYSLAAYTPSAIKAGSGGTNAPGPGVLTGVLPSPLHTGTQLVTGTGGVAGLMVERITQGSYGTPGTAGWVSATVRTDHTWTATVTDGKANLEEHIYARNGGSATVVELVHGTPTAP